jgi:hypothetical protein
MSCGIKLTVGSSLFCGAGKFTVFAEFDAKVSVAFAPFSVFSVFRFILFPSAKVEGNIISLTVRAVCLWIHRLFLL